jgi:hypothetical protein
MERLKAKRPGRPDITLVAVSKKFSTPHLGTAYAD